LAFAGNTYFVTTTGYNSPSRNGTSEGQAWKTIQYAANRANSGDIVYVKSGVYDVNNDYTSGSWTEWDSDGITITKSNVQFIGYSSQIGDLNSGIGVPANYSLISGYESANPPTMPVILGQNRSLYTAITVAQGLGYVTIQNFWIKNFQQGIILEQNTYTCYIQNIVGLRFGDKNSDYDGIGFAIYGSGHSINNCIILNSCAEGFAIHASGCFVTNCKAYADDNSTGRKSAMDYYFLLDAQWSDVPASGNTIQDCDCERYPDPTNGSTPDHEGHGFLIQAYANDVPSLNEVATDNTIQDCWAKSIGDVILVRGKGAYGNRFLRCYSDFTATIPIPSPPAAFGCIALSSTKNNTFSRIWLGNSKSAIFITGLQQETDDSPWASETNIFENCIFHNCEKAIDLSWHHDDNLNRNTLPPPSGSGTAQDVRSTYFNNCTFVATTTTPTTFFGLTVRANSIRFITALS
jgi:hypothetical protein